MSIELGKFNQLEVVKEVDFGVYLDGGEEGEPFSTGRPSHICPPLSVAGHIGRAGLCRPAP